MADKFEPREEELDADDYRAYFESHILRVWHLQGKQRLFRIYRVTALTSVIVDKGVRKQSRQPKLELATRDGELVPLPLLLNKTNAKTIAQLYGKRPADWVGKWIQLYPTTTEVGGETRDCIRVRPQIPGSDKARKSKSEPPPSAPAVTDHDKATKNEEEPDDGDE